MKKSLCIIACSFLVSGAVAQQPQRPSDDEINGRMMAIRDQLQQAQDQAAIRQGQLMDAIAKLQRELDAAKKQCPAPEPKKPQ